MDRRHWHGSRRAVLRRGAAFAASGMVAATLAGRGMSAVFAQATPAASPTALTGYPEIKVTITDRAVQASAATVAAGYALLTFTNQTKQPTSGGILGPGPGQTMAALQAALQAAAATPNNQFPPFLYGATILGGPGDAQPGGSSRAVVKIPAGRWAIFAEGPQPPALLTATAASGNRPEPAAAVQVTEVNFAFGFERAGIRAGRQVWKVTNAGTQPHEFNVNQVPAGTTFAQVLQVASLPPNATPAPGMLPFAAFRDMGGVSLQSPGQSVWTELELTPGRYAAMCFVPDKHAPTMIHAMEGMIALFDVR